MAAGFGTSFLVVFFAGQKQVDDKKITQQSNKDDPFSQQVFENSGKTEQMNKQGIGLFVKILAEF